MVDIEVRKFKDMNLEDSTIFEGFPGVGLVSAIASTYLIDHLNLDQICALECDEFPPTSMIYDSKPKFPARIYACEEHKIGVFISEFSPPPALHRPLAKKLLEWGKEQKCKRIVSTEAIPIKEGTIGNNENADRDVNVFGIGSTDRARLELEKIDVKPLTTGIIYGVSGVLLNEGRWNDFDVITLLAEAYPDKPDAIAAAKIIEALDVLTPQIKIEVEPLYEQSRKFEEHLKTLRGQAKPSLPDNYKIMYS
jgi:uncharacterized protein